MSQPQFQQSQQIEYQLDKSRQFSNLDVGKDNIIQYQQKNNQLWSQVFVEKDKNSSNIRYMMAHSNQKSITLGKSKLFGYKTQKNSNINLIVKKPGIQNTDRNKKSLKYSQNKVMDYTYKQKSNVKSDNIGTRSKDWVKEKDRKLFEIARTQFKRQSEFCYFSPKLL